jgi:hypothetical protein
MTIHTTFGGFGFGSLRSMSISIAAPTVKTTSSRRDAAMPIPRAWRRSGPVNRRGESPSPKGRGVASIKTAIAIGRPTNTIACCTAVCSVTAVSRGMSREKY